MDEQLELNIWIHENVFGLCWHDWKAKAGSIHFHCECGAISECYKPDFRPDYSGNISDAWRVVEKLGEQNIHFLLHTHNNCAIAYRLDNDAEIKGAIDLIDFGQFAESMPKAICLAAKAALEAGKE